MTIIGNLDESGYLRRDLENIIDDLAFSQNLIATKRKKWKSLYCSRFRTLVWEQDLWEECLLLQLQRKEVTVEILTAQAILENCFDEFSKNIIPKFLKIRTLKKST